MSARSPQEPEKQVFRKVIGCVSKGNRSAWQLPSGLGQESEPPFPGSHLYAEILNLCRRRQIDRGGYFQMDLAVGAELHDESLVRVGFRASQSVVQVGGKQVESQLS